MKAVALLSGGIDSAATLYYARSKGYKLFALTFDYGQRHKKEIDSAKLIAAYCGADWKLLKIELPWKGSSLLDNDIAIPEAKIHREEIPSTYVPARNIIFLSYAVSYAEAIEADSIFIGANQIDYSGYPDCRYSFITAFAEAVSKGTRTGAEGRSIKIEAPFINMTKADIIRIALDLDVPIEHTWSCYKGEDIPCGVCDSCLIRKKGFEEAGIKGALVNE